MRDGANAAGTSFTHILHPLKFRLSVGDYMEYYFVGEVGGMFQWSGWLRCAWEGGGEREGGLLGSTLTRFDTRDGRERRRTLRSTIRGSNWWTNTCKHVSIYHLYTLAYTYIQRSTFGPTQASGTRVTCVLTKGLKGRKEEMTPLQWQSTFWSIFLSSSRLHGLIPPFFTHFMRLFSFLTVCSCFLKLPFYSVVTIFCNFFFLFFSTSLFFFTCYTFFCHKDNLEKFTCYSKNRDNKIPSLFRIPSFCVLSIFDDICSISLLS